MLAPHALQVCFLICGGYLSLLFSLPNVHDPRRDRMPLLKYSKEECVSNDLVSLNSGWLLLILEQLKPFSEFMGSHLGEDGILKLETCLACLRTLAADSMVKWAEGPFCLMHQLLLSLSSSALNKGSKASGARIAVLGSSPFQHLPPMGSC